jgi:uncharacterized protein
LFYEVGEDYASKRVPLREAHLEKAWKASERGDLVLAGAYAHPLDGAVLLFKGDSPEVAEKFAREDPYVTSGAVKRWYVREWTTVAGDAAARPIKPNTIATGNHKLSVPSQKNGVILRVWKGRATAARASEYVQHATTKVFPALSTIEGHRGAYLLRRAVDGVIEFQVLTFWDSMAAVRGFAGADPEKAVVEPEARAILTSFDESVNHFEIVHFVERLQG